MNNLSITENNRLILLGSAAAGVAAWLILKKLEDKNAHSYPIEIDVNRDEFERDFMESLSKDHERTLTLLQKLYPDECTLTLDKQGRLASFFPGCCSRKEKKIIILNSIEAVKRFSKTSQSNLDLIPGRPKSFLMNILSKGYLGSLFRMYDAKSKEIRKSSLAGLHKLMSLPNFDSNLVEEVQHFISFIEEKNLKPGVNEFVLENAPIFLQQISTNMIVMIGLGLRFNYEHQADAAVKQQINHISELLNSLNVIQIDGFKETDAQVKKDVMDFVGSRLDAVYGFLTGAVVGYKSNYDSDVLNTFADFVIGKQREKLEKEKRIDDSDNYSDKDIIVQVFTLLIAGAVTTGFTLSWAFYYLANNPQLQEKIFEEISRVAGTSSVIYPKNRANFTYTNAAVNEILRLSSTQALIPRSTQQSVKIDNYNLPAETTVLINTYAIHRDERYWKEGEALKPERWIDESGQLIQHLDSFIAYGVAPRACLGDGFSRVLLFLIISNLIKQFQFEYVPSKVAASTTITGTLGFMRRPHNYQLRIKRRN
jgi:hypothetical protein